MSSKIFIESLFKLIAETLIIQSITIDGKVIKIDNTEDEDFDTEDEDSNTEEEEYQPTYQYELDSDRFHENYNDYPEEVADQLQEILDNHQLQKIMKNHEFQEILDNPKQFQTMETWHVKNESGWNDDRRGSNETFGINVRLPFVEEVSIPKNSTLDDVIMAFLTLRSHKFENWYEMFSSAEVSFTDDGDANITLEFDHGS